MKQVYAEITKHSDYEWQASILIVENGLGACPGLDYIKPSKEAAESYAEEMARDYVGECNDQDQLAEYCGIRYLN